MICLDEKVMDHKEGRTGQPGIEGIEHMEKTFLSAALLSTDLHETLGEDMMTRFLLSSKVFREFTFVPIMRIFKQETGSVLRSRVVRSQRALAALSLVQPRAADAWVVIGVCRGTVGVGGPNEPGKKPDRCLTAGSEVQDALSSLKDALEKEPPLTHLFTGVI